MCHFHIFNYGESYFFDVALKVNRIERNQFAFSFGRFSTAEVVSVLLVNTC